MADTEDLKSSEEIREGSSPSLGTKVWLVSRTMPADPELDSKDLVAYVARVSNPENQMNTETSDRLLKYLIRNNHWSPFEHVYVTLGITAPRDICRQLLRHRSFTFQEYSQRYAVANNFVNREARLQDQSNRQASNPLDPESNKAIIFNQLQDSVIEAATTAYTYALGIGIAKECARALLPEGLTESTMYMTGCLRSWYHYCELRAGNGTQLEHQQVALQCKELINRYYQLWTNT